MINRIYNKYVEANLYEYKNLKKGLIFLPWQMQDCNYYTKTTINLQSAVCVYSTNDWWVASFLDNQFSTKEEAMMEVDAVLIEWGALEATEKMIVML